MLHVLLDEWVWGQAMAHPVTVLFLLGPWLAVFPAVVWEAGCKVWFTTTLGRANITIIIFSEKDGQSKKKKGGRS